MESYIYLFEKAIMVQAETVGQEKAYSQAKKAGLNVSPKGTISSCTGHPTLVLLRLIRSFTEDGNLAALEACAPLIEKMSEIPVELEPATAD
ncbi:MAG: hypothetical protein DRP45_06490 [Candidatus Zixiibacteriota bacterium]|nr:MAG: hypothetical protein DRP45_06490 [candidate division Zixibacteria bacterium]